MNFWRARLHVVVSSDFRKLANPLLSLAKREKENRAQTVKLSSELDLCLDCERFADALKVPVQDVLHILA